MIRKTVHFSGTVQGIGFRYTAHRLARGFAVTGYVRNLPDARVELVAEGEPEQVARLLDAVQQAMHGHIRDTVCSEAPATGAYHGFEIIF